MIRPLKIKCFRSPLVRSPRDLHAIIFAHVIYQLHELLFAHIQCFRHGDGIILRQEFRCDRFECRFTLSFFHRVASLVFPIPCGPCGTHQGNLPFSSQFFKKNSNIVKMPFFNFLLCKDVFFLFKTFFLFLI